MFHKHTLIFSFSFMLQDMYGEKYYLADMNVSVCFEANSVCDVSMIVLNTSCFLFQFLTTGYVWGEVLPCRPEC